MDGMAFLPELFFLSGKEKTLKTLPAYFYDYTICLPSGVQVPAS